MQVLIGSDFSAIWPRFRCIICYDLMHFPKIAAKLIKFRKLNDAATTKRGAKMSQKFQLVYTWDFRFELVCDKIALKMRICTKKSHGSYILPHRHSVIILYHSTS